MFKDLANIASLMKNAQQLQAKMGDMQQKLGSIHVEGTAGGGMVTVTASGHQQIVGCRIEPALLENPDKDLLEELIVTATNQALEKAKLAAAEKLQEVTGSMPGLGDMMSKFGGG
jgi:DNA-binding YbaB/EbfC family protein